MAQAARKQDDEDLQGVIDEVLAEIGPQGVTPDILTFLRHIAQGDKKQLTDVMRYRHVPVGPREFIESPEFLNVNGRRALWPGVIQAVVEINSGRYTECVLTGPIGVAKTTVAIYSIAYQTYLLSCLRDPHFELDQDPASEIVMVLQSKSSGAAKKVDYNRLRNIFKRSPYFTKHFPFDTGIESELRFANNIFIRPISGEETGAIGENVIGGIIDEINYMAVIEKSKRSIGGDTSLYDQAAQNYEAIARRRQSRFLNKGFMPGMLCLVSSRKYPGQFTDRKEEEARTNPRIYVYDVTLWKLRPERFDLTKMFWLFKGDASRKARILEPGELEKLPDEDKPLCMEIPETYRDDFVGNMIGSLRDIAGVSALALNPWISDGKSVSDCFAKVLHVISREECDFVDTKIQLYPKRFMMRQEPRWAHLDLAETGDSAGLAIGYCSGFKHISRTSGMETLPEITFDVVLEVKPPRGGSIVFADLRRVVYAVRKIVPVKWVSLDSFQSTDTIQIMAAEGFVTGKRSVDRDLKPYSIFRQALSDRRILAPPHAKAQTEILSLEYDSKHQKVDHPPHSSKDVADAMAGVVHGLTMRREVWIRHGVSLKRMPPSIAEESTKAVQQEALNKLSYADRVRRLRHMPQDELP